jgi:hypothetical protein
VALTPALRTFALVATAALLLSTGVAAASGDSDRDGIPDDVETSTSRSVIVHDSPGSFVIRSRSVGAALDDAYQVGYSEGKFTVEYFPDASGSESISYQLEFRRILEVYSESGEWKEAGRFDIPSDYAEVRESEVLTRDGETAIVYAMTNASGVFTVTVASTHRFARLPGDRLLSPMEVKADIEFRGWTYTRSDSRLALQVEINSSALPRVDETSEDERAGWATDEAAVTVASGSNSLFFSWDAAATVDGVSTPVEATPLEPSGSGYEMMFVYGRGAVIVHDPKVGAVSNAFWSIWFQPRTTPPAFDATFYIVGIGAAAGVVGATVFLRRRRRTE